MQLTHHLTQSVSTFLGCCCGSSVSVVQQLAVTMTRRSPSTDRAIAHVTGISSSTDEPLLILGYVYVGFRTHPTQARTEQATPRE